MGSAGCGYHLPELNSAHGEPASLPGPCDAEVGGKSSAPQKAIALSVISARRQPLQMQDPAWWGS